MRSREKQDHARFGSHAKPASQSLTERRFQAADRSRERQVTIGMRVKPHRANLRRQHNRRSIGVWVRRANELPIIV